jgi:hypothetical protein
MKRLLSRSLLFLVLNLVMAPLLAYGAPPTQAHNHGHTAPHNGVLNEITACGVGHAEALITGDKLEVWFLDGGSETGRSIQIPDESIPLSLIIENRRVEAVLAAEPMLLAGEKKGKCSRFQAVIPGLGAWKTFDGYGWVRFKGSLHPLRLSWPKGFEASGCGHDHGDDDDHTDTHDHSGGHDHDKAPAPDSSSPKKQEK